MDGFKKRVKDNILLMKNFKKKRISKLFLFCIISILVLFIGIFFFYNFELFKIKNALVEIYSTGSIIEQKLLLDAPSSVTSSLEYILTKKISNYTSPSGSSIEKFNIETIHSKKNSSGYWLTLAVTRIWGVEPQTTTSSGKELWFVSTAKQTADGVSPLGKYFSSIWDLDYIDETTAVVRQRDDFFVFKVEGTWNNPRHPYWAFSMYGGSGFRLPLNNQNSFDTRLTPLFDPACEDISDQDGNLPMTNLVGGVLHNFYMGDLKFYFTKSIPTACIETKYEDYSPTRYISPSRVSATYKHPDIQILWPGGITVLLHVDPLRENMNMEWSDISRIMSFSRDEKPLEIKKVESVKKDLE